MSAAESWLLIGSIIVLTVILAGHAIRRATQVIDDALARIEPYTLDDTASHRPESDDEQAWAAEYLTWVMAERRKSTAQPYDWKEEGL